MQRTFTYYSHNHENDTAIEYITTGLYSALSCSYLSEDPDCGIETIHFVCKSIKSIAALAYKLRSEITRYLDCIEEPQQMDINLSGRYSDYSRDTLYAVESALSMLCSTNLNGRPFMIGTIEECAVALIRQFKLHTLEAAYIAEDWSDDDPVNTNYCGSWSKIVNLKLPFNNRPEEMLLAIGYCGGGNVATAYTDGENDDSDAFVQRVVNMICQSIDTENKDTEIYMEFKEKTEE